MADTYRPPWFEKCRRILLATTALAFVSPHSTAEDIEHHARTVSECLRWPMVERRKRKRGFFPVPESTKLEGKTC